MAQLETCETAAFWDTVPEEPFRRGEFNVFKRLREFKQLGNLSVEGALPNSVVTAETAVATSFSTEQAVA